MDIAALASALAGAQTARMQMAIAARMLKMNADASTSVVKLIEAAQQNLNRLANVGAGIGENLDVQA
jgi:hypothetical protein